MRKTVVRKNCAVVALLAASSMMAIPAVAATVVASPQPTSVSRSFPKPSAHKDRSLLAEAVGVNSDDDEQWGGMEQLDVPQTESAEEKQARLDAEEADRQRAAREEAERQRQQEEAAAAASRGSEREALTGAATPTAAGSATGSSIAAYATQFIGYPYVYGGNTPNGWDCSGFVQYVFAQYGVSLPHPSGSQMTVGSPVASIAEAQPGDIIANASHAAIYIGGGLVVNALNPAQGTQITGLNVFYGGYAIRRVV